LPQHLKLLSGDPLRERLVAHGTEVFRYRRNAPVFTFLTVLATACGVAAGWVYTASELRTYLGIGAFSVLLAAAVTVAVLVIYWTWFVNVHFLAVTTEELLIGRSYSAWSLSWRALNLKKMGFYNMDGNPTHGVLRVQLDGKAVRLHLFNPFAYVDNLERFMLQVLTRLRDHGGPDSPGG
jgi:hypothetical protein